MSKFRREYLAPAIFSAWFIALAMSVPTSAFAACDQPPKSSWIGEAVIVNDPGGFIPAYHLYFCELAARGIRLRIYGTCGSACTLAMGMPRHLRCLDSINTKLIFHQGSSEFAVQMLTSIYPPALNEWITRHGGLTERLLTLAAPELFDFIDVCENPPNGDIVARRNAQRAMKVERP